ncbi:MAG TPA: amidohydrolase family protein, partial [Candidatus Solibacter sp.]|nr:amidohydrolase family protein [Candidatus Solibacter sp.]
MKRYLPVLAVAAAGVLTFWGQSSRPEFKPTPEVPAMPKALMKLPRTPISRAKFPAVDFHLHGRALQTAADYQKMIALMDQTGIAVISNMDGGYGKAFDQNIKTGDAYKDRVLQFARLNYEGINEPGWSEKATAELERCFRSGAQGLKIAKELGLTYKNKDGSYIQADDKRFDSIWELCARYNRPVMIHLSDSYGRFLPIGPENERYEAGLWRSNTEGNYYMTGHPTIDVIEKARENMHTKHPNTRFVNAHFAMLYYDMDKVASLLDRFPNADIELSATVQDLGRAPRMIREFFIKYQNRILFGSDGNPGRGIDEFWVPHWRFL